MGTASSDAAFRKSRRVISGSSNKTSVIQENSNARREQCEVRSGVLPDRRHSRRQSGAGQFRLQLSNERRVCVEILRSRLGKWPMVNTVFEVV
jgi:hypothetical protein